MDMFEKAARTAKDIGTSIYTTTKEQSELASLLVQKTAVEKKLNDSYAKIGKKYVEYMNVLDTSQPFDVSDIYEGMKQDLDKLEEIKQTIDDKQRSIKQNAEEKAKQKAEDEFEAKKEKLDKALDLDIISREEYDEKYRKLKVRLENYETLKKIDIQFEMGIIDAIEREEKIAKVLGE